MLPPAGRLLVEDDGCRVQCHLCVRWWAKLGTHVHRGHGMDPVEYHEQFWLNRTTGLIAPELALKLADLNRDHLARARPPRRETLAHLTLELLDRRNRGRHRLQRVLKEAAARRQWYAADPERPVQQAAYVTNPTGVERSQRRLSQLRTDPAWAQAWRQRVSEGRRALTPEQVQAIRAQRGKANAAELAERYGVSRSTVWRIWRGELRPD